jgi:hypothetical protein
LHRSDGTDDSHGGKVRQRRRAINSIVGSATRDFKVAPAFRLRGAPKRRFGATAAGGFHAASRRIAFAGAGIVLFE